MRDHSADAGKRDESTSGRPAPQPYAAAMLVELGSFGELTQGGTTGPGETMGAGDSGVCC